MRQVRAVGMVALIVGLAGCAGAGGDEAALFAAKDELGVLAGDLSAGRDALRLEPKDELEAQLMAGVAQRFETIGEALGRA